MRIVIRLVLLSLLAPLGCGDDSHDHEHEAGHEHGEETVETAAPGIVTIDPEMRRDLRITTARSESRTGGDGVVVLGELRVNEEAYGEAGTAIASRVVRVLAAPGAAVKAGDPLVELESAELGRARAEHLSAGARAELARQALERKRGLVNDRIAAKRELQEAQAELTAARAELRAARAGLAAFGLSEADIRKNAPLDARFTLRSPVSGTVLERTALQGQMTEPGTPLFRIGDLSRLWLVVQAFERDAVRVKPGDPARVTFSALPGRDFSGAVTLVGSQVDTISRTIPVRIEVENPEGLLRPGMSATAWLPLGDAGKPIVTVPAAALQRTQDGWSVFLPREDGTFETRSVGRGRDQGGEVAVVSGLAPPATGVVEGAFLLKAELEKSRGEGGHHDH